MKIATAAEMREIDRRAMEEAGIPGVCLMQSAGEALARACLEEIDALGIPRRAASVAFLCGKGNNGGDGFVAARFLGSQIDWLYVFLTDPPESLNGDARIHFDALQHRLGLAGDDDAGTFVIDWPGKRGSDAIWGDDTDERFDVIVDCVVGTGATGALRGNAKKLLATARSWCVPSAFCHIACDIPSGVDSDTGEADESAFRADRTVTFVAPKPGLLLFPGAEFAGRVTVADLGIPGSFLGGLKREITTADWVRRVLPARTQSRDANKGSHGKLLVVAGSHGMAGAAVLTATAALRAGAGLVYLAVPESLVPIVQTLAPEVVLRPLPESGDGALEILREAAEGVDAVALGPGLGQAGETRALVESFLSELKLPVVIDADGLPPTASLSPPTQRVPGGGRGDVVLTPHPGEAARLLGISTAAVQDDREGAATALAAKFGATVLLKGARTLIATPDGKIFYNRLGSVALGTAGSGDVLTGVVGAFLATAPVTPPGGGQGAIAARAGAWLHARAGELCEAEIGAVGVVAREIAERLPEARRLLYTDIETENEL